MKKLITVMTLIAAAVFSCTGCSLFSDSSVVKFGDIYTHKDPKELTYDERIVLSGDGFESTIESIANQDAYPDTMMYDDDGNPIGMYDYDENTGLAYGWNNIEDGTYTAFDEGEEVDLGKPDASKMIKISGTVTAGFVVYGNQGTAVEADMYLFLSDASDKQVVEDAMSSAFDLTMSEESDTVLKYVQDEAYINKQFEMEEEAGYAVNTKDASAYAEILKQIYGVRPYGGENPYKPYADHQDPEDVDFDERVVLTGAATQAVPEDYADDVASMTEYVYGKDGEVVADYTYIECVSKDAADKIEASNGECLQNAERVSDTVFEIIVKGEDMQSTLTSYIGYNVLSDKSVDDYVRMLQETYFTTIYE